MLETYKKINFEPVAGYKYPITITLPCGVTYQGMAVCEEDIVCNGILGLMPGFASLEIDDLTYIDEHDETQAHDLVEECILFGMHDGSCMQVRTDYGLEWELSDQGNPIPKNNI